MRPALYGGQIRTSSVGNKGTLKGINLGYNFYVEHEAYGNDTPTDGMVRLLNVCTQGIMFDATQKYGDTLRARMHYSQQVKKVSTMLEKVNRKLAGTPFQHRVLSSSIPLLVRSIKIDNSALKSRGQYNTFLTSDGEYTLVVATPNINRWKTMLSRRRVFSEDELLYMDDYQQSTLRNNLGYCLNGRPSGYSNHDFVRAWDNNGFLILFRDKDIAKQFVSAINRGVVGVVPEFPWLFGDRGCCFVVLDSFGLL